ncbi:hypothetical protein RHO12_10400 [Orbus sturtevantii]|uniref:phage neck terminator protein n=1 Tax=Orbus sturtevantii TaxID=3074109 RepID=UPI00370DBAC1
MAITTTCQFDIDKIRQLIADILSLPKYLVIDISQSNDLTAYTQFITVLIKSQYEIGSEIDYDASSEIEIISSLNELTLSVNAYGANGYDEINKLVSSMNLTSVWERLKTMKIGYLRSSQIQHLSTDLPDVKEPCAHVDLIFSINNVTRADVKRGESVQIITEVN